MTTTEEVTTETMSDEALPHKKRAEDLKETLEQIIIDLDPSYGEVDDADRELYIAILESSLVELNELAEDFD